jgi:hypothetical protein
MSAIQEPKMMLQHISIIGQTHYNLTIQRHQQLRVYIFQCKQMPACPIMRSHQNLQKTCGDVNYFHAGRVPGSISHIPYDRCAAVSDQSPAILFQAEHNLRISHLSNRCETTQKVAG